VVRILAKAVKLKKDVFVLSQRLCLFAQCEPVSHIAVWDWKPKAFDSAFTDAPLGLFIPKQSCV
jgi:hypothetical protein